MERPYTMLLLDLGTGSRAVFRIRLLLIEEPCCWQGGLHMPGSIKSHVCCRNWGSAENHTGCEVEKSYLLQTREWKCLFRSIT